MSKALSVMLVGLVFLSLLTLSCQAKPSETQAPKIAETVPTAPATPIPPPEETPAPAPKAASFLVSGLSISPAEVTTGSSVTIAFLVTNNGELSGTYTLSLKVDGVEEGTEQVTLEGGASKKVIFTSTKNSVKTYSVVVDGLSGKFTVKEPPKAPTVTVPKVAVLKVKWFGQSTFLITADDGTKIITDPYNISGQSADIVTVSHEHRDHNDVAAVGGSPQVVRTSAEVKGIKFTATPTFHDDSQGSQRGKNTVISFEVSGFRITHLGDLGHLLSDQQIAEIGRVDILLIPVGGFYTIDAAAATQVADQLKPKVIIPMHYNKGNPSAPPSTGLGGVNAFLEGKSNVTRLNSSEIEFKAGQLPADTQIIVLQ